MRGTHVDAGGRQQGHRIIPADAGNTGSCVGPSRMGGDHPRGCGEHKRCLRALRFGRGSSPRMRGTQMQSRIGERAVRIIPADAENTMSNSPICAPASLDDRSGSSPRMRRTLQRDRHLLQMCGIIPADAGNTCSAWSKICFCWDHPRGCGEHMMRRSGVSLIGGSSPRMRGTLAACSTSPSPWRIIPADAGNTNGRRVATSRCPDHPRGCGEHKRFV